MCFSVFTGSSIYGQNSASNCNVEEMIKNFYREHCRIWESTPRSIPANLLYNKIDSNAQRYCTMRIRNEAREWDEDGHDLYTNDYGIVSESFKSFSIKRAPQKTNTYIVTYLTINYDTNKRPVKQRVTLRISVVKIKDGCRINEVH